MSADTADTDDGVAFPERAAAALTACMTVLDDTPAVAHDSELFEVVSDSGKSYVVDLRAEACDCPDCLHRGVTCKHLWRVRLATGRAVIPSWVDVEEIDDQLGQQVASDPLVRRHGETVPLDDVREGRPVADGGVVLPAEGDVVVDADAEDPGEMRVLQVRDVTALEHPLDEGRTIADVNPDEYADSPVVECVFERALDLDVGGWRHWPADELAERLEEYIDEWGVSVQTYDSPAARLEEAADE